jgi:hypothetical protein
LDLIRVNRLLHRDAVQVAAPVVGMQNNNLIIESSKKTGTNSVGFFVICIPDKMPTLWVSFSASSD